MAYSVEESDRHQRRLRNRADNLPQYAPLSAAVNMCRLNQLLRNSQKECMHYEIVTTLENSLWEDNSELTELTPQKTSDLLKDVAILSGATICKEIIELLSGRISLKLGVSVNFLTNDYSNIDRDELPKKFADEIYAIKREIIAIKQNLRLNILENALTIINEQYNTEITLNALAESIGYNASYLSHLFKKITGETFMQYKNRLRVENAAKLLESSNLSITEIALNVGYGDTSYFIQAFKKYYNETPKNYRNKMRGIQNEKTLS